ncbi:GNAT family N-acetyltransferase [Hyphococcus sp.]|uniref:GNAT family N-acetyltransferase n=1 Tax=Hyphococcus sp. TaxID=2038636 RepID=UPI00208AC851|nr:MAG: phosphinothricin N-acetyltransferase [Marinicaulis sp.]
MSGVNIRLAGPDDSAGINDVYNPFICDTAATFETVEHSETDRRAWFAARAGHPRHPVLVAERDGAILGFASASAFDPRGAYETSVKTSVFLAPAAQGQGLGFRLYSALFGALAGADVHRAYGLVAAPNPASAALHLRLGFSHVSTLSEVGRKFGRFHDVMWFEKRL